MHILSDDNKLVLAANKEQFIKWMRNPANTLIAYSRISKNIHVETQFTGDSEKPFKTHAAKAGEIHFHVEYSQVYQEAMQTHRVVCGVAEQKAGE